MTLGVVLIVRNEEDTLRTALESVKGADVLYVADTGSTDNTKKIACEYTNNVYDFPWTDSFADARNFIAGKAETTWLLSIDADHELLTPIEEIRDIIVKAEEEGHTCVRGALWKRGHHKWTGRVHECLSPGPTKDYGIKKRIGYSKNHESDPERNLKLLLKEEETPRTLFYLAREYYTLKRYAEAVPAFEKYIAVSTFAAEKAEAYYNLAWCLWLLQRGDEAREKCGRAIALNPTHWEALNLMADMHYEPLKTAWRRLAKVADGSKCIFLYQRAPRDKEKPGLKALREGVMQLYPKVIDLGIYCDRNIAGTNIRSKHAEGRAWDAGVDKETGPLLVEALASCSGALGISRIIYDGYEWTPTDMKPYAGKHPHDDHLHIELTSEAEMELSTVQVLTELIRYSHE